MLSLKLTSCRECAEIPNLLNSIDCKLSKMANTLYLNIAYMLNKPTQACIMSSLLHYKRILTYKQCNADWASDYSVEDIASRVNYLTAGCKCCEESAFKVTTTTTTTVLPTTTTTTTTITPTTTTTTTETPLTLFNVGPTDQTKCLAVSEEESYPLYHDGDTEFPMVGDKVYMDSQGLVPFYSGADTVRWADGIVGDELMTDVNGVMLLITCI